MPTRWRCVLHDHLPSASHAKLCASSLSLSYVQLQARPPMAVTNAVSWRSEGIRHKKNEVFLDVVESVNLLVNSNGAIVRSEVTGALKMRTALSGMPECKLGLNDKVLPGPAAFALSSLHDWCMVLTHASWPACTPS